jgi:predicted nucleic acid-binding protein
MTVIWGFKATGSRRGNPKQKDLPEMQRRARILIDVLEKENQMVILPAIALAEVLIGVEEKHHDQFISEIQKHFFCPPFDVHASAFAAKLWIGHSGLAKSLHIKRETLKADVQIVATAIVAGATRFYTHDEKLRKLSASAGLPADDLPTHHQSDMFFEQETEG